MKKAPVVAIIGAASLTFGPKALRDLVNHPGLDGTTVRFMDIDEPHMDIMTRLARRLVDSVDHHINIESTTDRREALKDADYVLINIEVDRYTLWKQDFSLPVSLGVKQVTGELGGPGGLFHSLRQIPLHLEVARDMETLCPNAVVMVESNPLNRICLALERYANVGQIMGLCHGVEIMQWHLGKVLGLETDDILATAAGTNHLTWILDLRLKATGEDLYPLVREKLAGYDPKFEPLTRKLFEVYGYIPSPGDNHIGEYIPYAWEFIGLDGPPLDNRDQATADRWAYLDKLSRGGEITNGYKESYEEQEELRLTEFHQPRSWVDTLAFPIINAVHSSTFHRMPAVNMLNNGAIRNLPDDIFVEAPAAVDSSGTRLLHMGELPKPLAAFCRRDIDQMELTVEAAVTGSRNLVLQAMLLDPVIDSVRTAERVLDQLLAAQSDYLPQFA